MQSSFAISRFNSQEVQHNMAQLAEVYTGYRAWPTCYNAVPKTDEAHFQKIINKTHFVVIVAMAQDKIVGEITGFPLNENDVKPTDTSKAAFPNSQFPPRAYHIKDLIVHPDYQHQGIASKLLEAMKQAVKETGNYDSISVAVTVRDGDDKFPIKKPQNAPRHEAAIFEKNGYKRWVLPDSSGCYVKGWTLVDEAKTNYPNRKEFWSINLH